MEYNVVLHKKSSLRLQATQLLDLYTSEDNKVPQTIESLGHRVLGQ